MNIMEFAINMEVEGEKFYSEQANKVNDKNLKTVLNMLAEDEKHHAEIIRKKIDDVPYDLDKKNIVDETKNIFKGIEDFKSAIKETPDQLDFYRDALKKEQESIDLYEELLSKATDLASKELFEFLINEEKEHYTTINELVQLLKHAEEWVENPEFGLRREEY